MLNSCMTPLRRFSFETCESACHGKHLASHRPLEIVGTVTNYTFGQLHHVRWGAWTISREMYWVLISYHGNPQPSFSNRNMIWFCRCPHLNQPKMLELTWRLPTVVLLLSLPFTTLATESFPRTRERARAIREEIVAGRIYSSKMFVFLNVVVFCCGFEYYFILRNGHYKMLRNTFQTFFNRRMKSKLHLFLLG